MTGPSTDSSVHVLPARDRSAMRRFDARDATLSKERLAGLVVSIPRGELVAVRL